MNDGNDSFIKDVIMLNRFALSVKQERVRAKVRRRGHSAEVRRHAVPACSIVAGGDQLLWLPL